MINLTSLIIELVNFQKQILNKAIKKEIVKEFKISFKNLSNI